VLIIGAAVRHYNSKFSQHIVETGHAFGKINDIKKILHYDKKETTL
jgi:hypothetical protein